MHGTFSKGFLLHGKAVSAVRPDRLILVKVSLLEMAELGLQVLEVLRDAFILLGQPHVALRKLLLVLRVALLQAAVQHPLVTTLHSVLCYCADHNTFTLWCLD